MTIIILLSPVPRSEHRFLHRRCESSPEVVGAGLVPARKNAHHHPRLLYGYAFLALVRICMKQVPTVCTMLLHATI